MSDRTRVVQYRLYRGEEELDISEIDVEVTVMDSGIDGIPESMSSNAATASDFFSKVEYMGVCYVNYLTFLKKLLKRKDIPEDIIEDLKEIMYEQFEDNC